MNGSRPLVVVAVVLAVVDAALLLAWLQRESTLPAAAGAAPAAVGGDAPPGATAAHDRAGDSRLVAGAMERGTAGGGAGAGTARASDADVRAVVFGTVCNAAGTLLDAGTVHADGDAASSQVARIERGTFAFPGLAPGSWTLRVDLEDTLPFEHTVDVRAPHTRVDLRLDAEWRLLVHARTPDGEPLMDAVRRELQGSRWFRGLAALAFPEPLAGDLPASNRDDFDGGLGTFRGADAWRTENVLPKESVGLLVLPADRPVHVALLARNVLLAQQRVEPGRSDVTFTLPVAAVLARTATVRARVVDPRGAPVAGALVALNDDNTSGGGVPTDADGRATLRHLKPGLLNLEVRSPAGAVAPCRVPVPSGANLDLGELVVRRASRVELVFAGGTGRVDVRVAPMDAPPHAAWRPGQETRVHDRPGPCVLSLAPGRHGGVAIRGDLCALFEVDTTSAPSEPVRVELRPSAPLRIRSRIRPGFARVTVRSQRGIVVVDAELATNQDHIARLPPGTYDAEIAVAGGATERRSIVLGSGGALLTVP